MKRAKHIFKQNELWILSIGGAFQRANVYKDKTSSQTRRAIRNALKNYMEATLLPKYNSKVTEQAHISTIEALQAFSQRKEIGTHLQNGALNFGVCQKLVNLYLKYQWVFGTIQEPPHFPVDRIIQSKMGITKPIAWTKMTTKEAYLRIIEKAKKLSAEKNQSLAEWELTVFNRR